MPALRCSRMILGLRLAVSAASQCLRRQQCPFANSGACRKALVTGTGDKVGDRTTAATSALRLYHEDTE